MENKLLASVPCFQKIRLLFTNDLYFLTITCRPSRSFFLFPFCFIFIYSQNYTPVVLYEENFSLYIYILIHDKLFLYTHWNSFSLRHTVYIQTLFTFKDFFIFPNTHLWFIQKFLHIHSLLTHTRIPFHASFTHKDLLYTFSFYIHV